MAIETKVARRIEEFPKADWGRVYPDILEGYLFHKSVSESPFKNFSFYYIMVYDNGTPVGAAPCFLTNYSMDTSIKGPLRNFSNFIRRSFPNIFSLKTLVCGVPISEGVIGATGDKERIVEAIYERMEKIAEEERAVLIAFKDFTADYEDLLKPLLKKGFSRIEGLPSTAIDIDFADFDEYLKTLSGESRSDLRRKFKKVDKRVKIDMEVKNRLEDGPLLQVYNLYLATLNSHEFGFEVTPIDFFRNISINMPDQARFFLWRIDGKLVAFTFSLVSKDFFSDYYVGFDYSLAYKHHLYFVRFRDLMNWCIEHGIKRYDMGVTSYEPKKRLGFRPVPLYIYAVCRNRWFRPIFNILCRILAFENFDPALGEMKRKRYKDRNAE